MGLRNGSIVNALCPGFAGPSDIDNVIHNNRRREGPGRKVERVLVLEYKGKTGELRDGQRMLLEALAGRWEERSSGRQLETRVAVLPSHPPDPVAAVLPWLRWVWNDSGLMLPTHYRRRLLPVDR